MSTRKSGARVLGVTQILNKHYRVYELPEPWASTIGQVAQNFRGIVYGASGNGKTVMMMQLVKVLAATGKVYYNSAEEGDAKTIQDAYKLVGMHDVAGNLMLGDRNSFDQMMAEMKRGRYRHLVIDSRDFLDLTANQYRQLIKAFPNKSITVVCWSKAGMPKGEHAAAIEYMCDVKIHVDQYVAYPRSRFGGNQEYWIWPEKVASMRKKADFQTRDLFNQQIKHA